MSDMSHLGKDAPVDLEQLRARLRKMTDDALVQFGKDAAYMCSPKANRGKPPREAFVIQLEMTHC